MRGRLSWDQVIERSRPLRLLVVPLDDAAAEPARITITQPHRDSEALVLAVAVALAFEVDLFLRPNVDELSILDQLERGFPIVGLDGGDVPGRGSQGSGACQREPWIRRARGLCRRR